MKAHDGAGVGSKASVARVRVSGRRLEETDKATAFRQFGDVATRPEIITGAAFFAARGPASHRCTRR